jgi:hypothetical protein
MELQKTAEGMDDWLDIIEDIVSGHEESIAQGKFVNKKEFDKLIFAILRTLFTLAAAPYPTDEFKTRLEKLSERIKKNLDLIKSNPGEAADEGAL